MAKRLEEIIAYIKANPRVLVGGVVVFALQSVIVKRILATNTTRKPVIRTRPQAMTFSEFLRKVEDKEISKVLLGPETLHFSVNGKEFLTKPTTYHPGVADLLHSKRIAFDQIELKGGVSAGRFLYYLFPFAYLALCLFAFRKILGQQNGTDTGPITKKYKKTKKGTTFADVAGVEKAKGVVYEVAEFMRNPEKFTAVGARVPTGILLVGPPGTGKTMLAKAMANEAGMPFFYCSGSDFVEVFAGRGASRVRKLFERAAKASPCVVFFDEIDALGKSRGNSYSTNEEREQTLNQLLASMDGFNSDDGVMVMAATNRYDVLDKALTRPGRFDRIVKVELPDEAGRHGILKVHTRDMKLDDTVDLELIAAVTKGFSGAELAHLANEAAITAVRSRRTVLCMQDFLEVVDEFTKSRNRPAPNTKGFMEHLLRTLN